VKLTDEGVYLSFFHFPRGLKRKRIGNEASVGRKTVSEVGVGKKSETRAATTAIVVY